MSTTPGKATSKVGSRHAPLLQDQLCFAVYSASHAISRRYKPLLRQLDLTYPQYLCMLVLWEADDVTVGAIGSRLFLDSGTLTPLLKRLEQGGFVRRVRDADDERQVRILLTAHGRSLGEKAAGIDEAIACASGLQRCEIVALRDGLLNVRHQLDQFTE